MSNALAEIEFDVQWAGPDGRLPASGGGGRADDERCLDEVAEWMASEYDAI